MSSELFCYNFFATCYRTFRFFGNRNWGYDRDMKTVNLFVAALILSLLPTLFEPASAENPSTAQAQASTKSWLIRLVPPRPNFADSASPAEQALMQQHIEYWKNLNAKGICEFGGPVLDPKGVYGMLVVYADTLEEARALGEADPSVKAGVNKIEVAEMHVAFVPQQHS
jgi:uncharacterized protein